MADAPTPEPRYRAVTAYTVPLPEPVGYDSKTGHGTHFRETITPELAALAHGVHKMWTPLYTPNQMHAHAAAVTAAKDAEIAGLRAELLREHADHKETIEDAATVVHQNTALHGRIKVLEDALRVVMNYTETHSKAHIAARAALRDKTP